MTDKLMTDKLMTDKLFIQKYQPLYFKDFGSNNEIINILKTLIEIDDINILLIGDIACGKTSLLNAVIREYYNSLSPKEYEQNVLYINTLREQGINYYRTDVKIFCQTCSNIKNKKKIIVLDDIDLINEQSQQVFRNCIDKFSHNVNFIASCNNNQKVIESLQSRLNIIKIRPPLKDTIYSIINKIQALENIEIENEAKEFIINISNNTIKVIINYMEKFKLLNQKITLNLAQQLCSTISFLIFEEYTNLIISGQLLNAINLLYDIYEKGYSVMDILDNYFIFVKTTKILTETQKYEIIPYICKYIAIFHNIHEDEIELPLFTNELVKIFSK
jgi:DNA polymerase III delta prime subunit